MPLEWIPYAHADQIDGVCIDLETGGLGDSAPILSIGAVACLADGRPVRLVQTAPIGHQPSIAWSGTFHQLVQPRPGSIVAPEAIAVNGYSEYRWINEGAIPELDALQAFTAWLRNVAGGDPHRLLATAHKAAFDCGHLEHAYRRYGIDLPLSHRWACTMQHLIDWRRGTGTPGSCGLADGGLLCGHWTSEQAAREHHHALHDALACAALARWLRQRTTYHL